MRRWKRGGPMSCSGRVRAGDESKVGAAAPQSAREAALAKVEARRADVRRVLEVAPAEPGRDSSARWVDSGWLAGWADGAESPPPVDNAPLLCEHGRLDPFKATGAVQCAFDSCATNRRRQKGKEGARQRASSTVRCCCASTGGWTPSRPQVRCDALLTVVRRTGGGNKERKELGSAPRRQCAAAVRAREADAEDSSRR